MKTPPVPKHPYASAVAAFLAIGLVTTATSPAVNVTTQKNDNNRSGLNASETTLTTSNVNQTTFGKLFEKSVDGDMYAQPLYMQGVSIGGGTHNVIYCATANNSIYAFDADSGSVGAYWNRNLATAVPQGDVQCCCTDVSSVIGIISTGVIDTSTNTWYVVNKQKNADASYHYFLHAIDITTGNEKFSGPKEVSGSNGGQTFNARINNQRSALLLQGGNVYFAFSSHNDCGDYHGFVFGYSASTLAQVGVWASTTNSGSRGGIWMGGGGLVGDGTSIYCTTGNGNFNANSGGTDLAMSAVRLNSTVARQDYFTPHDWSSLSGADLDLAGGGIMLIPGTQRLVVGGKPGRWHLINTTAMGGFNSTADSCLQTFMVTDSSDSLNHIHGGPSFFNNTLYVGGESDELKAFSWNGTTINTTPSSTTTFEAVTNSMPGWQHCVSANGTSNAIIWAARVYSGNANNATQPGILHAFSATNLATELWNSKQNAARDDLGNFAKNPSPTVVNGKVYCPTFSNKLCVYGLLSAPSTYLFEAESLTVTGQTSGITYRTSPDSRFSGGNGAFFDATAAGQFFTYSLPSVNAGTYDVKVGVKDWNNKGIWQASGTSNIGPTEDEYTVNETFTEVDLGNWTVSTTGNQAFTFTVTGKNASSSGFGIAVDYIKLTAQSGTGGAISGAVAGGSTSTYNLTTLGTSDWAHWNGTYIHKSSGGSQISNVTQVGGGNYGTFTDNNRNISWSDGTPTGSGTNDHGYIWCNNVQNAGWSFTVPADTTSRTLNVLYGGPNPGSPVVTIRAHLSDNSAADFVNSTTITSTVPEQATITYHAASAGQTLTITLLKTNNSDAASVDLDAAWLTTSSPTGSLSGNIAAGSTSTYNLTTLGTTDWAHWNGTYNHKSSGGGKISDVTHVGGGNYGTFNDTNRNMSWSDGTPVASNGDDTNYIWCNNVQNSGWSFTVPADTTSHTLNVLYGGATAPTDAVVKITAHLSDNSAADFTNTETVTNGVLTQGTFTYHAASAGQTLTITLIKTSNADQSSVDLDSAWLQ